MSDMSPNGGPPLPPVDPGYAAMMALLEAIPIHVAKSRQDQSAAEAKDRMNAALMAAQAVVMLDPTRMQGGETPETRKASTPTPPTRDTDRDGKVNER